MIDKGAHIIQPVQNGNGTIYRLRGTIVMQMVLLLSTLNCEYCWGAEGSGML
jgi:hypothetical protein